MFEITRNHALDVFGFQIDKPVIAVIGGSQGSHAINKLMKKSLNYILEKTDSQLIWQTGKNDYPSLSDIENNHPAVKIFSFIDQMGHVYSAADLIVSRAGALSSAEITYCGKPSILIPFPHATGDHQTKNARTLSHNGAAVVLDEEGLTPEIFGNKVVQLLSSPKTLLQMSELAKLASIPNSAEKIVDEIMLLAEA
jgi:UDP-N-acetylglucosamine--N-acetylmuramyl-(pentapeptide) pyrophosphoryl-undecaprenol N-acetylglucosamine transferase|tara:strand:- start:4715 stop:5302 length:588 start_codon:yes stop_codon:yes gene_type:complete